MVLCLPETRVANVPNGGGSCIDVSTALVGNFLRNPELGWDINDANLFVNNVVYLNDDFFEDAPSVNISDYLGRGIPRIRSQLDSKIFEIFGATGQTNRLLLEDTDTTIVYYFNLNLGTFCRFADGALNESDTNELLLNQNADVNPGLPEVTNFTNTTLSFYRLFEVFFGPRHSSNLYGQSDIFYEKNRDFDDSYHILSELGPLLCAAIQRRLQVLFERFPNHNIALYVGHRANADSPLEFSQGVQSEDPEGITRYDDSDQTHFNIGARNFILYANRLGVYSDPDSRHFIPTNDNGPEIAKGMLTDSTNPDRKAKVLTQLFLKGDDQFAAAGDNEVYIQKVLHSQIHDALSFTEASVQVLDRNVSKSFSLSETLKNDEKFIDIAHLAMSYDNEPFNVGRLINRDLIQSAVNKLCSLTTFRNKKFKDIYLWSESTAEDVGIFLPEFGVFPSLTPLEGGGTQTGGPSGPLFNLDLFNVSGCEIPPLPLPQDKLQVIQDVITGEAFRSPVEQAVSTVLTTAGDFTSAIVESLPSVPRVELGTYTDENGVTQVHNTTTYVNEVLSGVTEISEEFQSHAYRLSGVSNYRDGFDSGGSIGDLPGLVGIQAIAQNYNNVKNSLDSGTLGQDLIDHYSPFFGSILGPGDQLYESLNTLLDGDFRNFLTQFPINDNRLDLSEATVQQISELRALGESAFALRDSIRNLIDSDNLTYFAALDYLAKSTLGFSVLSMLEDPCFSQKLLGQIAKPDLKGLLNI